MLRFGTATWGSTTAGVSDVGSTAAAYSESGGNLLVGGGTASSSGCCDMPYMVPCGMPGVEAGQYMYVVNNTSTPHRSASGRTRGEDWI